MKNKKERDEHSRGTLIGNMLRRDDKGISEAEGILSRLLRIIMFDKDITMMRYSSLMKRWLESDVHTKDRLFERGNLNKEIYKPNMTLNGFIKALVFLRVRWFTITIKIGWEDADEPTEHSVTITDPNSFVVRKDRSRVTVRNSDGKTKTTKKAKKHLSKK